MKSFRIGADLLGVLVRAVLVEPAPDFSAPFVVFFVTHRPAPHTAGLKGKTQSIRSLLSIIRVFQYLLVELLDAARLFGDAHDESAVSF